MPCSSADGSHGTSNTTSLPEQEMGPVSSQRSGKLHASSAGMLGQMLQHACNAQTPVKLRRKCAGFNPLLPTTQTPRNHSTCPSPEFLSHLEADGRHVLADDGHVEDDLDLVVGAALHVRHPRPLVRPEAVDVVDDLGPTQREALRHRLLVLRVQPAYRDKERQSHPLWVQPAQRDTVLPTVGVACTKRDTVLPTVSAACTKRDSPTHCGCGLHKETQSHPLWVWPAQRETQSQHPEQ